MRRDPANPGSSADRSIRALLRNGPALPAFAAVGLMLLWAAHDGGYDADTWYWGALVLLALLVAVVAGFGARALTTSRATKAAMGAFGLYVAWSYLSIAWATSAGAALEGSNRALLYLLIFSLFAVAPWTPRRALAIVVTFAVGLGTIGAVMLARMATGHAGALFGDGRLVSPTGYFNATAALFTTGALLALALSVRRELPALLRGVLLALACGELQLAVLTQSRGWLFTLPLIVIATIAAVRDRLRVGIATLLPVAGTLVALSRLLAVYRSQGPGTAPTVTLVHAAQLASRTGLLVCAAVLIAGSLIAAGEVRAPSHSLGARTRRALAAVAVLLAFVATAAGTEAATHGHPFRFLSRQWHGFTRPPTGPTVGSHFGVVGSGRYDIWRVSLDALTAHPVGGLGQDNFADYYVTHRRTHEEPSWTHSVELRLLTHTGLVGFGLFVAFLVAALSAALRARRRGDELVASVAGAALLPLVVWLIHGSVDWFWEMPALSGPALGLLGMAAALSEPRPAARARFRRLPRLPRAATATLGVFALIAAVVVLGFPYLAVREVSTASDLRGKNPSASLRDLANAANLNPLSSDPGRLGGTIALQSGEFTEAEPRFRQAISREPGDWFSWLGDGLAASALGDATRAQHDFAVAASINPQQRAVRDALARVDSTHPLTPSGAFRLLVLTH